MLTNAFNIIRLDIVFCKEWYQDHWNWLSSLDSKVNFQNTVIVNFLFILVSFQAGLMAFLTSIHCCLDAHWSMRTKQRENLWTAIPAVNTSHRFNKICKWLCFKKWLYTQYYQTKSYDLGIIPFRRQCSIWWNQNMLIFEFKSNENQTFWFVLGTPGITCIWSEQ